MRRTSAPLLLALLGLFAACSQDDLDAPRIVVPESEKNLLISSGDTVEIEAHLPDEGWTLVEFGAPWCPGCVQLAPEVEALVADRPHIRLRRIDVKSWDSPVVQQHSIRELPQLWLYAGKERLTADKGRSLALVRAQR